MFGKKEDEVIKITTVVGEGAELNGNFSVKGSARIDGVIKGDVKVEDTLILGATGVINGKISAQAVLIGGEVIGDVNVPVKTELTSTAKVVGDITTAVIVIDENAVFQGKCNMDSASEGRNENAAYKDRAIKASKKSAKAALDEALKEVKEAEEKELEEEMAGDGATEGE